jgi:uncharacterized protein (TIGR03067 family)
MKLLSTLVLLAGLGLVLAPVSGAGGQKDKGDKKGKEQPAGENLDGTWQVVSVEVAGKKEPDERVKGTKLVIKGNAFTLYEGKLVTKGTFKADPNKSPKEVDSIFEDDAGNKLEVKLIYEVKGDTMRACGSLGKDRPKEFKSTTENGYELVTYKKVN